MPLSVSVRAVGKGLALLIVVFSVASFVGQVVSELVITENDYVDAITHLVDVNAEASVPTWYAAITLMACSVLLGIIAADARLRRRPYAGQWALLSIGFVLLSIEEIIGIHSQATRVLRSIVSITEGPGYVLALGAIGLAGLVVLGLVFGRFFMHLPSRWRVRFAIGGVIYLTGVFGSDAVGDYLRTAFGPASLLYIVVLTVEEALEMIGVLIFIVALLEYIRAFVGPVALDVRDAETAIATD